MRASQRSTITLYWYNVQIVRDHRCVLSSLIVVTVWNIFIFFLFQIQSCIGPCGPLCPPASHSVPLYIPVSSVSHCVPLCPTMSYCVLLCPLCHRVLLLICVTKAAKIFIFLSHRCFLQWTLSFSLTCFKSARDSRPVNGVKVFPTNKSFLFWLQYKRLRLGTGLVKLGL